MSTSGSPLITRDLPTKYTFVALVIIATMSAVDFGIAALIIALMFLAVAVICSYLVSIVSRKKDQRGIYSSEFAARALLRFLFQAEFPISFVIYPHNGSQNPVHCRSCDVRCCRRISYAGTTNLVVALSAGASGIRQRVRNKQEPLSTASQCEESCRPFQPF